MEKKSIGISQNAYIVNLCDIMSFAEETLLDKTV
jgi:hypothetical protein